MTAEFICFFPCIAIVVVVLGDYIIDSIVEIISNKKTEKEENNK